jgi:hypothetical protein
MSAALYRFDDWPLGIAPGGRLFYEVARRM